MGARFVVAADGRSSRLARALGLARYARAPRRWAVGGYFTGVTGLAPRGEMHVRSGRYIGVAPLPDGLTNVCVVTADRSALRDPGSLMASAVATEPELADRFADGEDRNTPGVPGTAGGGVPRPGEGGPAARGRRRGIHRSHDRGRPAAGDPRRRAGGRGVSGVAHSRRPGRRAPAAWSAAAAGAWTRSCGSIGCSARWPARRRRFTARRVPRGSRRGRCVT